MGETCRLTGRADLHAAHLFSPTAAEIDRLGRRLPGSSSRGGLRAVDLLSEYGVVFEEEDLPVTPASSSAIGTAIGTAAARYQGNAASPDPTATG